MRQIYFENFSCANILMIILTNWLNICYSACIMDITGDLNSFVIQIF